MEPDTVSRKIELSAPVWHWDARFSLTRRILAVNIFALAMLAGSFFYLDGYRARLIQDRATQAANETRLLAIALAATPIQARADMLARLGHVNSARLRIITKSGTVVADSWPSGRSNFVKATEAENGWAMRSAGWVDVAVDTILRADAPPNFSGFSTIQSAPPVSMLTDHTHVLTATAAIDNLTILRSDRNARDIRKLIRSERSLLSIIIGIAFLLTVLLSLFLARTIVGPLRSLVRAAVRVRTGRDRAVVVPRLPDRNDEIGMLARAVSDMSEALRQRMDAMEAFAADVAHELKNPLASLNSAVESLRVVQHPEQRAQLNDIIGQDAKRLDRLVTDISALSRLEPELARTGFEAADIDQLISDVLRARPNQSITFEPVGNPKPIRCDPNQIARMIDNLIDNAVSFSPKDGHITIATKIDAGSIDVTVDDDGPGIDAATRETIFQRFHSVRPETEPFGQHSGLGLAIARSIVNAHGGAIIATERPNGANGARFMIQLPLAEI